MWSDLKRCPYHPLTTIQQAWPESRRCWRNKFMFTCLKDQSSWHLTLISKRADSSLVFFICRGVRAAHVFSSMLWCSLRFPRENDTLFVFTHIDFVEVHVLFMFLYLSVHWCPTWFPYLMMFVLFSSNTTCVLVEKELLTLPEYLTIPPILSGIWVAQSLV